MSEGSVNVESRTSSQDKRWTIMAALLGTNTAVLLFQGIEQEANPKFVREVALTVIAATIPFQGIYFLIKPPTCNRTGVAFVRPNSFLALHSLRAKRRVMTASKCSMHA